MTRHQKNEATLLGSTVYLFSEDGKLGISGLLVAMWIYSLNYSLDHPSISLIVETCLTDKSPEIFDLSFSAVAIEIAARRTKSTCID